MEREIPKSLRELGSYFCFADAALELDVYLNSEKPADLDLVSKMGNLLYESVRPRSDVNGKKEFGDFFCFTYLQKPVEKMTGKKIEKVDELALETMVLAEDLKQLPSKIQNISNERIAKLRDLCIDLSQAAKSYHDAWDGSGVRHLCGAGSY